MDTAPVKFSPWSFRDHHSQVAFLGGGRVLRYYRTPEGYRLEISHPMRRAFHPVLIGTLDQILAESNRIASLPPETITMPEGI